MSLLSFKPPLYWKNYNIAKGIFKIQIEEMRKIRPGVKIVLHHMNLNDLNYENWWPVIPMYKDEHDRFHNSSSTERNLKISKTLTGKKHPKGKLSEEHKQHIRESHMGKSTNKGKHWKLSEEARQNIKNAVNKAVAEGRHKGGKVGRTWKAKTYRGRTLAATIAGASK